jgi:hypothetical protein
MRSSITTAIVAASFAFSINAAMAASPANPIPQHARSPHAAAAQHVAARRLPPRDQLNGDVAQFIRSMLGGGPIPYANLVRDVRGMPASSGSYDWSSSPSYDTSAAVSSAASETGAF